MKSAESIRINLFVHKEKDPALFQELIDINEKSRARRLLGIANVGLLFEKTASTVSMNQSLMNGEHIQEKTLPHNKVVDALTEVKDILNNNPLEIIEDDDDIGRLGELFKG